MFNKPSLPPQPLPTGGALKEQPAPAVNPGESRDVYVMPEKFHPTPVHTASSKPLIIAAVVLAAVVVLVAAYFIYDSSVRKQLALQQAEQNAAQQSSTPVVEEVNGGAALPNIAEPPATSTEATTTPEQATSSPGNTVASTTPAPATPPAISRDSDADGLTDMEEDVIGTNPGKPDTDVDGYTDSSEILSGYNPLSDGSQGKASLAEADFIAVAKSDFSQNNFSFLYPRRWKVSFIPENGQAIISIDTGEIIRISSLPDEQKVSAMNWYLQLHPDVSVSQLAPISAGSLSGFFTSDGLTAYLNDANKERIYSFEYLMSPQSEFRYPTLFAMIIKNFQLVAGTSTPPAGQ